MEKSKKNSSNNSSSSKAQNTLLSVLEVSKKLSVEYYNSAFTATASHQNLLTPISSSITNVSAVNTPGTSGGLKIPTDILDDLASRFIINIPDKERADMIRICFQIELAHWFYLDFMLPTNNSQNSTNDNVKKLPPCGIKQFSWQIFNVKMIDSLIVGGFRNYFSFFFSMYPFCAPIN
jgi:mRNA-decapping enzyme subunit 2